MRKLHIVLLVGIVALIVALVSYSTDFSTYDSIGSAKAKQGKFVHIMGKLDKTKPVEYDAVKNPNYLSFYVVDSLGASAKVVYHNPKPSELDHSERIVMTGKMYADSFVCKDILIKCPSKYKDQKNNLEKGIAQPTTVAAKQS